MKIHTTNYVNTFIEVAEDTKVTCSTPPPPKENKTVAEMQYELIVKKPYQYTSDDILFMVYAERNDISPSKMDAARNAFFSRGQACLRASPLPKTYGFGIHHDANGKVALYGMETEGYQKMLADDSVRKVKAMRLKTKHLNK